MLARIAAVPPFKHLPDWSGDTARSESYRRAGPALDLTRKSSGREERYSEVTEDTIDRQEENVVEVDELLVEEVSIDGMCGVY
jgi:mycofactocin precursor